MASKRRRKVQSYDPRGREAGYYEEEDGQMRLLEDAWSEEAREAALEARRSGSSGKGESEETASAEAMATSRARLARIHEQEKNPERKAQLKSELTALTKKLGAALKAGRTGPKMKADSLVVIVDEPASSLQMYDAIGGITCVIDDGAKMEITSDGWLKAMPRIARTGIQLYQGDECGRGDMDVVRVFRPEASVFSDSAIHSYTHLPITIDHPGGAVDAVNWKKHAVGETGDEVLRDGGSVRVPMMLRDAKAIEMVKGGKRELSVGYGCELDWSPGVTPDGESYDAIQRNIRGNHLAIVTHARGGSTLRIGDSAMTELRTVLIDGLPCQMSDKDAAIVQRCIQQLQDQNEFFKKFKKGKEEEEEEKEKEDAATIKAKDAEIATRDGKITALEQQVKDAQLTPEKLDAMVNDRLAIRDQVRKMLPTFKYDGKSDADIRRAVVASKLGDERAKAMSDENVIGAYQAYASAATPAASNPINDARAAFAHNGTHDGQNPKVAAFNDMVKDMENAWRTPST